MVKLESFADLSQPQDDLFTKAFAYANYFGLHYTDTDAFGMTYRVSAKQTQPTSTEPSGFVGGLRVEKQFSNGFTLREDLDASQTYKAAVEYRPLSNPDLKVQGEFTAKISKTPEVSQSVAAEYTFPNAKVSLAAHKASILTLTSVAGTEHAGVGLDLAYSWGQTKLTACNVALYLIAPDARLVLKRLSHLDANGLPINKVALSGFAKVSPEVSVGVEVEYDSAAHRPQTQLAVQRVFNEFHTGKLRIRSTGEVATSVTHRLNKWVALTSSSSVSFKRQLTWPFIQMGFKLSLTS
jgi:hypothetical protein